MTLRELLRKPFWSPNDLAKATGVSKTTARTKVSIIRDELEKQGYLNISSFKVPTKVLIDRLNIDLEFLEKNGTMDAEL